MTKTLGLTSRHGVHVPAGPAPWSAAQPGHEPGTRLAAAGPAGGGPPPASAGPLPACRPAWKARAPYAHLHHGDDEGQGLPTARWGRNTEVARPVAASAYQKPVGCALQESGNHCCLHWTRNGETHVTSVQGHPVLAQAPETATSLSVTSGLGSRSRSAPELPGALRVWRC